MIIKNSQMVKIIKKLELKIQEDYIYIYMFYIRFTLQWSLILVIIDNWFLKVYNTDDTELMKVEGTELVCPTFNVKGSISNTLR